MMKMSRIMAFLMAVLMVLPSATAVVCAADGSIDEDDYEIILEDECLCGSGDCRQPCVTTAPEPETKPVTTVKSESKPVTKKPSEAKPKVTEKKPAVTTVNTTEPKPIVTSAPEATKPDESLEEDISEDSFSDMFSDILSMFDGMDFDLDGFSDEDFSSGISLTPGGNMSLVDDIFQDESYNEREQRVIQSKQFITVQTKSGNSFYIIIDRTKDAENVYFLNLVDESDLLSLMEEAPAEPEKPAECICKDKDKCELGAVNAECEVCKMDLTKCIGKEKQKETAAVEPEKEAPKKEKKPVNPALLLLPLLALAGGGAYWFFKIRKPKPKNVRNPDDYDFEDSADYDEEKDVDETETAEDNDTDLKEDA